MPVWTKIKHDLKYYRNKNVMTQPTDHFFIVGHDLNQGASALRFFTEQVEAAFLVSGGVERMTFTINWWRQNRNAPAQVVGLTANTKTKQYTVEINIPTLQGKLI